MKARANLNLIRSLQAVAGWAMAGKADDPAVQSMKELLGCLEAEANG